MDWVRTAALVWAVLVLPLGLVTGFYLRRLNAGTTRPGRHPRRPRTQGPVVVSSPVRRASRRLSDPADGVSGSHGLVPPVQSPARSGDPIAGHGRRTGRQRTRRARPRGGGD